MLLKKTAIEKKERRGGDGMKVRRGGRKDELNGNLYGRHANQPWLALSPVSHVVLIARRCILV